VARLFVVARQPAASAGMAERGFDHPSVQISGDRVNRSFRILDAGMGLP